MTLLVFIRLVHFSCVLVLLGVSLFRPLLVSEPRQLASLRRGMDPWLCMLALLGFLTSIGWLLATAAQMTGDWHTGVQAQTLRTLLSDTFFGRVWAVHVVLCLIQLIYWRIPGWRSHTPALAIATLVVATLAPVGHGAMFSGLPGALLILNQLLHLVCVAAWLGALLLLLWLQLRPNGLDPRQLLARFSGYGWVLVAGILVTGAVNLRAISGSFWPTGSAFALVFAVKAVLVAAMLLLAWYNRKAHASASLARLRTSVAAEFACGLAAVAAVSLLGTMAPVPVN